MEERFTPDCCPVWPGIVWHFNWMTLENTALMPYIQAPNSKDQYRIQFCPSCGAPRRDVVLSRERLADLLF